MSYEEFIDGMAADQLDTQFLNLVRIFSDIGYGNMMSIIAREWARSFQRKNLPLTGVLLPRTAFAELSVDEQVAFETSLSREP